MRVAADHGSLKLCQQIFEMQMFSVQMASAMNTSGWQALGRDLLGLCGAKGQTV